MRHHLPLESFYKKRPGTAWAIGIFFAVFGLIAANGSIQADQDLEGSEGSTATSVQQENSTSGDIIQGNNVNIDRSQTEVHIERGFYNEDGEVDYHNIEQQNNYYESSGQSNSVFDLWRDFTGEVAGFGGRILQDSGNLDDAIRQYQHAIELDPDNERHWLSLAHSLYQGERHEEAAGAADRAVALAMEASNDVSRKLGLLIGGLAHWRLGALDEAEESFHRAALLAVSQGDLVAAAESVNGRGLVELARENPSSAIYYFSQALDFARRSDDSNVVRVIRSNIELARQSAANE